ncbi:hypothetical protein P280DRAFT_470448 [Massarina eburnea CBS 473.64]|uniref:Uncharacterized protein n=1 Tax=Massarina eburnea CBS 473.64 TaxID=1395130 RepID=A0A6A6RWC0_9PLEO|nr:hypothetical protein P280DRAFT_470448 [Massarina eburnea CBS 473.64]
MTSRIAEKSCQRIVSLSNRHMKNWSPPTSLTHPTPYSLKLSIAWRRHIPRALF